MKSGDSPDFNILTNPAPEKSKSRQKRRKIISGATYSRFGAGPQQYRPRHHPDTPYHHRGDNPRRHTTMVRVVECKPRRRWHDGCKKCYCDHNGKKHCSDSRCLKAALVTLATPSLYKPLAVEFTDETTPRNRPVQRPPAITFARTSPVKETYSIKAMSHCGKYKVGDTWKSGCNKCKCSRFGAKCTGRDCASEAEILANNYFYRGG